MLLCLLGLTLCPNPVTAQPGPQWATQQWTVEDGLPVNGMTDGRFGPGGYLLLTTFDGLVRFDGRDFVTYTASTHPVLPGNRFLYFVASAPDELLIVTQQFELVRMHKGAFSAYLIGSSLPGPLTWASLYLPESETHYLATIAASRPAATPGTASRSSRSTATRATMRQT